VAGCGQNLPFLTGSYGAIAALVTGSNRPKAAIQDGYKSEVD
jgi:hypothetical protein